MLDGAPAPAPEDPTPLQHYTPSGELVLDADDVELAIRYAERRQAMVVTLQRPGRPDAVAGCLLGDLVLNLGLTPAAIRDALRARCVDRGIVMPRAWRQGSGNGEHVRG